MSDPLRPSRRGFIGLMSGLMAAAVAPSVLIEDERLPLIPPEPPPPPIVAPKGQLFRLPFVVDFCSLGKTSGAMLRAPRGSSGNAVMRTGPFRTWR